MQREERMKINAETFNIVGLNYNISDQTTDISVPRDTCVHNSLKHTCTLPCIHIPCTYKHKGEREREIIKLMRPRKSMVIHKIVK